ncbi:MAG: MFS transporter [Sneathiella sp.]|nr:MFS transporter [Sneathiella sp.]
MPAFIPLILAIFVVVTAEFLTVGLLPIMADDLNISLAEAGWFVTYFALSASFLGPIFALLAARYNARIILITTLLIFAASNLAMAVFPNYTVIVAVRLLQGAILPTVISVASVSASYLTTAENEGRAIALVTIGVVGATLLGIPIGTLIAGELNWPLSFAGLSLFTILSAFAIAIGFPRMDTTRSSAILADASLLWRPYFLVHLLLSCILFTGMFTGYTYISALLHSFSYFDDATSAWVLMGFGIAGVFGNWLAGRKVDRDPLSTTAWVALTLTIAMAAILPTGQNQPLLFIFVIGAWGAAHAAAFVSCQVRVMKIGRTAPVFATSLNISICNLGIGLGATIGGQVVDNYTVESVGYFGAITTIVAFLIVIAMKTMRFQITD